MKTIDDIHRDVQGSRTHRREEAIKKHNEKTHVHETQFDVGDFVLVDKQNPKEENKLHLKWLGPRCVTRPQSEHTYEVQDILTDNLAIIHANRLKFYADSQLNVTEVLKQTIEHNSSIYNTITKLLDLRYNAEAKHWEVQCKWRGFDLEEPTWEP